MNEPAGKRIGILIVDDSAVVRQVLSAMLGADPELEIIAAVPDPLFALERMERRWPDVIVLDIEMPRMDGITFLRKIMSERPTPVVMCSVLTERGAEATINALEAGAAGFVTKPRIGLRDFLADEAARLAEAVKAAAQANTRNLRRRPRPDVMRAASAPAAAGAAGAPTQVIAVGASTGGVNALEDLLVQLPASIPGMVVVQHMPEKFTAALAQRLDSRCEVEVREARHRDRVAPGCVLIAPGGRHMTLQGGGGAYYVAVTDGAPVNHHKPSVDVLFGSVAKAAGGKALGIIMTGMGADGAAGLLEMRRAGAATVAQDEASCVVFGMPKEAIRLGAAARVLAPDEIRNVVVSAGTHA